MYVHKSCFIIIVFPGVISSEPCRLATCAVCVQKRMDGEFHAVLVGAICSLFLIKFVVGLLIFFVIYKFYL